MTTSTSIRNIQRTEKFQFRLEIHNLHLQCQFLKKKDNGALRITSDDRTFRMTNTKGKCFNGQFHEAYASVQVAFDLRGEDRWPFKYGVTLTAESAASAVCARPARDVCPEIGKCRLLHRVGFQVESAKTGKVLKEEKLEELGFSFARNARKIFTKDCADLVLGTNELTLIVDVEVAWNESCYVDPSYISGRVSGPSMSEDFARLFKEGAFSDVVLNCGGRMIRAYKFVLGARSDVLKAMLEAPMKEGIESQISIDDFEGDVMQVFVDFLSTDEVDPEALSKHCKELLTVADKYNVQRLKSVCEIEIGNGITVDNCAESLIFAYLCKSKVIFEKAIDVMKVNREEVGYTEGWHELQAYPCLLSSIALKLA